MFENSHVHVHVAIPKNGSGEFDSHTSLRYAFPAPSPRHRAARDLCTSKRPSLVRPDVPYYDCPLLASFLVIFRTSDPRFRDVTHLRCPSRMSEVVMTSGELSCVPNNVLRRCILLPSHAVARTMHASSSGAWSPGTSSLDSPALRVVPWTWHNVLTDPIPDVPQKATALPHYENVADEAAPVLPSVGSSSRLSVPDEGRLTAGPSPMKASTPPQDVIDSPSMGTWLVLNASASLRPPSTPREGDKEGNAPAPSPSRPPSPTGESQEPTASPHHACDSLAGHGTENGNFPLVRVDTATPRHAAPREEEKPTDDIPEGRNGSLRTPNGLLKDCAWGRPPEEVPLLSVPPTPAPSRQMNADLPPLASPPASSAGVHDNASAVQHHDLSPTPAAAPTPAAVPVRTSSPATRAREAQALVVAELQARNRIRVDAAANGLLLLRNFNALAAVRQ
jgi:hypothetical protein